MSSKIKALILLVFVCLILGGCKLGYVLHAAKGQLKMMSSVQSLDEVKDSGTLSEVQMDRVRLIQEVRTYAERELGLKKTENYTTIYPRPLEEPIFMVTAAPKDSLRLKTWWFPIVGRVPYLGFFDREKAQEERKKLEDRGYDVIIRSAEAYSTLGWFKDPITMNMLERSPAVLADTIIHELTHVTLYVKGQGAFNEGLASFMGRVGAVKFLEHDLGADNAQTRVARSLVHDERIFSRFLNGLVKDLKSLYGSQISYEEKLEAREQIYAKNMISFKDIKPRFETNRFMNFGGDGVNNAYLAALALYHDHFLLFEDVYVQHHSDLRKFLNFFVELSKEKQGDLLKETGSWLEHRKQAAIRKRVWFRQASNLAEIPYQLIERDMQP